MMDDELFDLCKEVYEQTGWDDTEDVWGEWKRHGVTFETGRYSREEMEDADGYAISELFPLYTSDYLLERLPSKIRHHGKRLAPTLKWVDESKWWLAQYYEEKGGVPEYNQVADTPLKSLLKLTIALDKAGELGR